MSKSLAFESELLDAISEASDPSEIIRAAFDVLDDTLDMLLKHIFYNDDFAVKYLVNSLLTTDGPLGDIMVRAKLLLALGVIDKTTYQDLAIFINLKTWTTLTNEVISFTDQDIIFELNQLSPIKQSMLIEFDQHLIKNLKEPMLGMQLSRHTEKVRSMIILTVMALIEILSKNTVKVCHN